MVDRLHNEIDDLLRRIHQEEQGDDWGHERARAGTEPEVTETIHVYIVRESDLEGPPDDLVVDSELVASEEGLLGFSMVEDDLPPDFDEDYTPPESDRHDAFSSLTDEDRTAKIVGYCTAGFGVALALACLVLQVALAFLTPIPTITLIPVARELSLTTTLLAAPGTTTRGGRIPGRLLPALTLGQTRTAPTTGKGHQDARSALGEVTFYNGLFTSQAVAAGTILAGSDGVQVVTDQVAVIPPARATTPPTYGQATVSAHALQTGPQGNIGVRDINEACCLPSVLAQNTVAFQDGQQARDYLVVSKQDIATIVTDLTTSLLHSEQAALTAQLSPGEAMITPTCTPAVTTDHQPGEEAAAVTVTVAERCTELAYDRSSLQEEAAQALTQEVIHSLGTHYSLSSAIQVSVLHATLSTGHELGIATITIRVEGTWTYQFSQEELQQIKYLIAGKTLREAEQTLMRRTPGIQRVLSEGIGENQRLPKDVASLHLLLLYGAG